MTDSKPAGPRRECGLDGDPSVPASETRGSDGTSGFGRVLVVDDFEDNRELYTTYFEHNGFETEQASDGEEALARIARATPDVVIMDLSMPKLDGWQATRLIKSNPKTNHVIVIVVSGNATDSNIAAARSAGADDICSKPCLPRDLLARVRRLLATRREKRIASGCV